ncbi:Glycerophosphodiester phosphodiesterase GDPDL1 [Glycine soja]|uniref:glycerophosphodiester phosphodiesterase n=2 Tax=Glycine soja TaxID=3848 RepID=A0A445FTW3_GLYSO|nr:Glycerophosphodiester phosphodiesterase GDPDL1 [Glycine soja]
MSMTRLRQVSEVTMEVVADCGAHGRVKGESEMCGGQGRVKGESEILFRNLPKNAGALLTLSYFLSLTKNQTSLSDVAIIVENATYLVDKQGLSVIDVVISALSKAGYDKPGSQKVYIQSTNSSVLLKFKEKTSYELVYKIDETVGDAANATVEDIKSFASSVVVNKDSVIPNNNQFLTTYTNIVPKLKIANLLVFVETFSSEFVSPAWDFFADEIVEINTYIEGAQIDGIITNFPKIVDRYRRNKCLGLGDNKPTYMEPVQPEPLSFSRSPPNLSQKNDDLRLIHRWIVGKFKYQRVSQATFPPLIESKVAEPPLPPVAKIAPTSSPNAGTKSPQGNSQPKVEANKVVPRDDKQTINRQTGSIHGCPSPGCTKKIFVGGLPSIVTETDLKKYFDQFFTITDVVVMYDHNTQRPRGFGFITYDSEEVVDIVLYKTFHELNTKMVEVKRAVPKELSPRPTRSPLIGYNYGLNRTSSFLNSYAYGFNMNPIRGYGVRMDGRCSPLTSARSGFTRFGSSDYGIGVNLDLGLNPSY